MNTKMIGFRFQRFLSSCASDKSSLSIGRVKRTSEYQQIPKKIPGFSWKFSATLGPVANGMWPALEVPA